MDIIPTTQSFTAYIEWDAETQLYVGTVPGLPGAHTQGVSLAELKKNLEEVVSLCVSEYQGDRDEFPRFIGIQQIEIAV